MSTLGFLHPTHAAIIRIIATHPNITVQELHAELQQKDVGSISLQNLYKIVQKLIEANALIKQRDQLSVHMLWLLESQHMLEKLQQAHAHQRVHVDNLPVASKQRIEHSVDTLQSLQSHWDHLLVHALKSAPKGELYQYMSHPWWSISPNLHSKTLTRAMHAMQIPFSILCGNALPLDMIGAQRLATHDCSVFMDNIDTLPQEGFCMRVYDSYIYSAVLSETLSGYLEFLFKNYKEGDTVPLQQLEDLQSLKTEIIVTVRYNPKEAASLRDLLASHCTKEHRLSTE